MHISPVSFKGTITIRKIVLGNSSPNKESYHTTKQQDKELMELAQKSARENITKPALYSQDVEKFIKKIEEITGYESLDSNPTDEKLLMTGGIAEGNKNFAKYNSAYNKIFFSDAKHEFGKEYTEVTIDTLEPEERKELAKITMQRIQKALLTDYNIMDDRRLDVDLIDLSNRQITDFPNIEKVLAKVLFYLDGNVDTPDPMEYAPKFYNGRQAYLALFNRIQKLIGTNLQEVEGAEAIAVFNDKHMESMTRAVCYLKKLGL